MSLQLRCMEAEAKPLLYRALGILACQPGSIGDGVKGSCYYVFVRLIGSAALESGASSCSVFGKQGPKRAY